MFKFSKTSEEKLIGVDPRLCEVLRETLRRSPIDFAVTCGRRTLLEQRELFEAGKSWTMHSLHLHGAAVDIVPWVDGAVSWKMEHFVPIINVVREVAREMEIGIRSGGAWSVEDIRETWSDSFEEDILRHIRDNGADEQDYPHLELL